MIRVYTRRCDTFENIIEVLADPFPRESGIKKFRFLPFLLILYIHCYIHFLFLVLVFFPLESFFFFLCCLLSDLRNQKTVPDVAEGQHSHGLIRSAKLSPVRLGGSWLGD